MGKIACTSAATNLEMIPPKQFGAGLKRVKPHVGGVHDSAIRVVESASQQLPSRLEEPNIWECDRQNAIRREPASGIAKHVLRMNQMFEYMRENDQIKIFAHPRRNSGVEIGDMHCVTILRGCITLLGTDRDSGNGPSQTLKQPSVVSGTASAVENAPDAHVILHQSL